MACRKQKPHFYFSHFWGKQCCFDIFWVCYCSVRYTRKQHCTFDSILSGFTVAWLHVSPWDAWVFFFITIIWWACVCPPSISSLKNTFECCNTLKQWWSQKTQFRNAEWWAGYQQLSQCIINTGSWPLFGQKNGSVHQNNWRNQSLSFYRHVYMTSTPTYTAG